MAARLPAFARALVHRNFRLFWTGNFLSNIGTWMQNIAQGWLVLQLEPAHSSLWLSLVGFASSAPMLLFTLVGGAIADRANKRKLMFLTQGSMMVVAFLLWGLTASHRITALQIVVLAFLTGTAMSLNAPTYQSMVPALVPREDLGNAIALNSVQFNLSRIVGPTLGGLCMAWIGISGNFLLNALSFVAVLLALAWISYPPAPKLPPGASMIGTIFEGFRYVHEHRVMQHIVLLLSLVSLCGFPYMSFIPYFAKQILHRQETGFGLLMAASGVGAVLGATLVVSRRKRHRSGRFVALAGTSFFTLIAAFCFSTNFYLSALLLAGIGFAMICLVSTCNTLLQHLSEDHMRGRVMSLYALSFFGGAPAGSLAAGALASHYGVPFALAGMNLAALLAVAAIYLSSRPLQKLD
jgi:MFS family permease